VTPSGTTPGDTSVNDATEWNCGSVQDFQTIW